MCRLLKAQKEYCIQVGNFLRFFLQFALMKSEMLTINRAHKKTWSFISCPLLANLVGSLSLSEELLFMRVHHAEDAILQIL